jgi:hypothetical protein
MDSVIVLKVKKRKIWPGVILVHQGASLTGSASIVGDILPGSLPVLSESPKGDAVDDKLEPPKGDAGDSFLACNAAFRLFT